MHNPDQGSLIHRLQDQQGTDFVIAGARLTFTKFFSPWPQEEQINPVTKDDPLHTGESLNSKELPVFYTVEGIWS